jgi:hypothetical protein
MSLCGWVLARPGLKGARWNIGPVSAGPMFHRAGGGPAGGRAGLGAEGLAG